MEYLGHWISKQGLQLSGSKIKAIANAPAPTNVGQLRAFLGLANYYSRFLPNLADVLAPLYQLLQKDSKWVWEAAQEEAFTSVKTLLRSPGLLVHYNQKLPLLLSCDASPYEVGAVLSHITEEGKDQPIALTSRSLAPTEKYYSQLDKEAVAIIFSVKKFHQYVFG